VIGLKSQVLTLTLVKVVCDVGLTVFMGGLGDGKTLGATIVGIMEARKKQYKLMANYDLYGSELITSFEQIRLAYQAQIILDEMHILANARGYKSAGNKKMTDFTLITRKHDLDIYMVSQHIQQIDIIVRNIVDYLVLCKVTNKCVRGRLTKRSVLELTKFDYQNMKQIARAVIPFPILKRFLNAYDTNEIPVNFLEN
jgi:hypothetical protein